MIMRTMKRKIKSQYGDIDPSVLDSFMQTFGDQQRKISIVVALPKYIKYRSLVKQIIVSINKLPNDSNFDLLLGQLKFYDCFSFIQIFHFPFASYYFYRFIFIRYLHD